METLGLSSTPKKSDNIFQRLLWPGIANQYDVDLLGQQGFWLCILIGAFSAVLQIFTGHPLIGVIAALIFFGGACGVRQRSVLAASLIVCIFLLDKIAALIAAGSPGNPVLGIIFLMLLLANVRAAILSRRWMAMPSEDGQAELPERSTLTIADRFANTVPAIAWPKIKYVFLVISALYLILGVVGTVYLVSHKQAARGPEPTSYSVPIQVGPPS